MKKNYYKILDINEDSTPAEIKQAFRALSKNYHPDNLENGDREKFEEIKAAYDILIDPEKRQYFDEFGEDPARQQDIINCAMEIFKKASGGDPVDIMKNMNEIYQNIEYKFDELMKECGKSIKHNKDILKRIKGKPKNDFISMALNQEISNKKLMIEQHKDQKEIAKTAMELLMGYSFEVVESEKIEITINGHPFAQGGFIHNIQRGNL